MSSGIPSGADLARKWIREIEEDCGKDDFAKWKNKVGISEDNVGEFYPQIYEKRFGHIPESGYPVTIVLDIIWRVKSHPLATLFWPISW